MYSPSVKVLRRFFSNRKAKPIRNGRPALGLERLDDRIVPAAWTARTMSVNVQSMMLMSDGNVLIQTGSDQASKTYYKLSPDSAGNYINGTLTQLASANLERLFFGSNVLPSGKVFTLGGEYSGPQARPITGRTPARFTTRSPTPGRRSRTSRRPSSATTRRIVLPNGNVLCRLPWQRPDLRLQHYLEHVVRGAHEAPRRSQRRGDLGAVAQQRRHPVLRRLHRQRDVRPSGTTSRPTPGRTPAPCRPHSPVRRSAPSSGRPCCCPTAGCSRSGPTATPPCTLRRPWPAIRPAPGPPARPSRTTAPTPRGPTTPPARSCPTAT